MINLFEKEIAYLDEIHIEAAKARTRELFRKRDELMNDPRQDDEGEGVHDRNSPAAKWLDDMCANSEALLRVYIENLATPEWTYKQITGDIPHALLDIEGERAFYSELQAWAEV